MRLLVAAPAGVAPAIYAAFVADGRFRVVSQATSPDDFRAKLALDPEAVVLDVTVFPGPEEMARSLSGYEGVTFALVPDGLPESDVEAIRQMNSVQHVVRAHQANFAVLAGRIYDAVLGVRQAVIAGRSGNPAFAAFAPATARMVGYRAVAVWAPQGGVGKSTVAMALAMEAAGRRLPALLVGLGGPDPNPLVLGLRSEPNILAWRANPTPEGLKAAVQKCDTLDVLAGFPDPVSAQAYAAETPVDAPDSVSGLVHAAGLAGYAVVVLDVSEQSIAPLALSAANTLVVVSAPTMKGVLHTVEAVRVLQDVLAGQHSIAASNIFLVVNRYRNSTLNPRELVNLVGELRKDAPPLAAAVADDPAVEEAENARRPAYLHSEPLRRAARQLGDMLFAPLPVSARQQDERVGQEARVVKLGPVRIRMN